MKPSIKWPDSDHYIFNLRIESLGATALLPLSLFVEKKSNECRRPPVNDGEPVAVSLTTAQEFCFSSYRPYYGCNHSRRYAVRTPVVLLGYVFTY